MTTIEGVEVPAEPNDMSPSDLVQYQRPPVLPGADEFNFVWQMANALCISQMVPKGCAGKPADVAIVLLAARDMGIPLTQAFAKLNVINGKLALSAEMMVALILRDGHRVWCDSLTAQECTAAGQRRGSEYVARFTFSLDDAVIAQLCTLDENGRPFARDDKNRPKPWEMYPKAMLWARAVSGLVRMTFPDVTAGVTYTPEELGDEERWTAHPSTAADQDVREAFKARIDVLPDEKKAELRTAWSTWGLSPLSRITVEEVTAVEELIAKAEAIDVEASGDEHPPARGDTAAPTQEASTSDPGPSDGAVVTSGGSTIVWPMIGGGSPVDTPDIGSVQHEPDIEGPSVFNGDPGHCSECGSPVWYSVDEWLHAEPADDLAGGEHDATLAGPEIDVDALYAATHTPPDPKVRRLQVELDVSKMSQTKVLQALGEAGLPIEGSPKTLKLRLVEHRLAVLASEG